jgi:dTMP kinase
MKMPRSTTRLLCRKIVTMPFVTFEGCEGCGKSTQVKRLAAHLQELGTTVAIFREPGGTEIGEAIRDLLQYSERNRAMTAETELLLFEASRSQLVREKISAAVERGGWVICDRFFDSTTVYQGVARNLDAALVDRLNRFAVGHCIPDVTFVLDIDPLTAQSRLRNRKVRDRMEEQPPEFYDRVRIAYLALAQRETGRVILIDGSRDVDEIAAEIWRTVAQRFAVGSETRTPHSAV